MKSHSAAPRVISIFRVITPLSAQISASNFHDLTQITQRRVCFNPKRTEKPKAHDFLCTPGPALLQIDINPKISLIIIILTLK